MDLEAQQKWDRVAPYFDYMNGYGPERRWGPTKRKLFRHMSGRILFLALGTGLDIQCFPSGKEITAIDISAKMLAVAKPRVEAYEGKLHALQMDAQELSFENDYFDQVFTSCTFCSVPDPIKGLQELRRVLKPEGKLYMFEHTGSRHFPFNVMLNVMTVLLKNAGPDMNRKTEDNLEAAGFKLLEVNRIYLDVVKTLIAAPNKA